MKLSLMKEKTIKNDKLNIKNITLVIIIHLLNSRVLLIFIKNNCFQIIILYNFKQNSNIK